MQGGERLLDGILIVFGLDKRGGINKINAIKSSK